MSLHRLSYIILFCLAFPFSEGWAQIKLNPVAILLLENGTDPTEPKTLEAGGEPYVDRKSTRLNSSHSGQSRMPSSA